MRKRMNRTWAEIPKAEVERLADGLTAKTYAADWMTDDSGFAFAEAILGQRLELSFPNDATLTLSFRSETELAWDDSDGAQGSGFYRAYPVSRSSTRSTQVGGHSPSLYW